MHPLPTLLNSVPPFAQQAIRLIQQKRHDVTTLEQIILLPIAEVQNLTGLALQSTTKLLSVLSSIVYNHDSPPTVYDMCKEPRIRLSWGDDIIDNMLRGGILPFGITEISGDSSSGKTQLCLQLLLQAQLPLEMGGLNGSAIYLSTEGDVPIKRLKQIAEFYQHRMNCNLAETDKKPVEVFFFQIFLWKTYPTWMQCGR